MSNQSSQPPPPAPHPSKSGLGNAVIVFNFITILICSATLLITLRIHQKVTPDREAPYWLKDKGQRRDPSTLPNVQPQGTPQGNPQTPGSPNLSNPPVAPAPVAPPADPTGTSWRSPIPGPGENITVPISHPGQVGTAAPSKYQPTAAAPKPGEIIPWHQAHQHFGRTITVEGKIVQMKELKEFCFLNFTNEPRGGDKFYFILFKKDFGQVSATLESSYLNKTLRVTGKISEHSGRIQMKINKPDQIKIID
jgi:hypothetical protein